MNRYTMLNVKDTAKRQAARALDQVAKQFAGIRRPRSGWIMSMRKALGMSAPALAKRAGVTKAAIYQAERKELEGGVTLKHMEKLAEALGGRFVYAIVPETSIDDVLRDQARRKAEAIVKRASAHMALEQQSLSSGDTQRQIEELTEELLRDVPADFWEAP
ncbi:mobile mystery protein A [Paracoccus onubensis]|uniref:Mobile mystery protein A n=2 Tax=Paracoccus onubensis TaxID=1675788 RepID=A0A418T1U8_9RHOB|nr:mobile mystery protein A [Paracoccus onubensis]